MADTQTPEVKTSTYDKTLLGPDLKVFIATYTAAKTLDDVSEAIREMGLSVDDVNQALYKVKREIYFNALSTTNDSKMEAAITALMNINFDRATATAMVEAQRESLGNSLPNGLTRKMVDGVQATGVKKGRKAADKPAEPVAA